MIASSAALFAVLATLAAGQQFTILPNAVSRDGAIAACANAGLQLAAITGATLEQVSAQLPASASGWIASWNGDAYGGACLQLKAGTITAAASCAEQHLPICEGSAHHSSSSSESCTTSSMSSMPVSSSSSTSCDLSSSSSSWSCDNSSSSFSCSSDLSSDICSSSFDSSSSSSSGNCDPCCAGVRKLTYQAPFGAGAYLAKVSQKFSVFDVFGNNACANVHSLAQTLGVYATLVGSDGLDACATQTNAAATAAQTAAVAVATALAAYNSGPASNTATAVQTAAQNLLAAALAAQTANSAIQVAPLADALVADAKVIITTINNIIASGTYAVSIELNTAVGVAVVAASALVTAETAATALPFGTYYTVSRAWALNQPVYDLLNGVVSAANSLYNCYGEYRAIYITKYLSDLTFVGNNHGNVCFDRCHGKPQSCLALCGGLQRPGYLPKFKIGA